jgi:hypothetical protein
MRLDVTIITPPCLRGGEEGHEPTRSRRPAVAISTAHDVVEHPKSSSATRAAVVGTILAAVATAR